MLLGLALFAGGEGVGGHMVGGWVAGRWEGRLWERRLWEGRLREGWLWEGWLWERRLLLLEGRQLFEAAARAWSHPPRCNRRPRTPVRSAARRPGCGGGGISWRHPPHCSKLPGTPVCWATCQCAALHRAAC